MIVKIRFEDGTIEECNYENEEIMYADTEAKELRVVEYWTTCCSDLKFPKTAIGFHWWPLTTINRHYKISVYETGQHTMGTALLQGVCQHSKDGQKRITQGESSPRSY